jgi:hypothetical protein
MHEASFRGLLELDDVRRIAYGSHGRVASAVLRKALSLYQSGSAGTKSVLEDRFLHFVEQFGLVEPEVNVKLPVEHGQEIEVDFFWPSIGLCVEVDGIGHDRVRTRNQDLERDQLLAAMGWTVMRCTATTMFQLVSTLSHIGVQLRAIRSPP